MAIGYAAMYLSQGDYVAEKFDCCNLHHDKIEEPERDFDQRQKLTSRLLFAYFIAGAIADKGRIAYPYAIPCQRRRYGILPTTYACPNGNRLE